MLAARNVDELVTIVRKLDLRRQGVNSDFPGERLAQLPDVVAPKRPRSAIAADNGGVMSTSGDFDRCLSAHVPCVYFLERRRWRGSKVDGAISRQSYKESIAA